MMKYLQNFIQKHSTKIDRIEDELLQFYLQREEHAVSLNTALWVNTHVHDFIPIFAR